MNARLHGLIALLALALPAQALADSEYARAIQQVKPSIVAVGTFERLRVPEFRYLGTGFAVGDGTLIATNNHVVPEILDKQHEETLAIALRAPEHRIEIIAATKAASEPSADLALLRFDGPPLPPLQIGDSKRVREGDIYLFTGFPLGPVLGLFAVTHRAMISAVTPIVIPAGRAGRLNARSIRQLAAGAYAIFELDGTAYPGNSGSPLYDPSSGKVMGIVNMTFVKGTKEAAITHPSGISYAIPSQKLEELLHRVR